MNHNITPVILGITREFEESIKVVVEEVSSETEDLVNHLVDKMVSDIHDKLFEKVSNRLFDHLIESVQDRIDIVASDGASAILAKALQGDDKTLKDLFGFSDWYLNRSSIIFEFRDLTQVKLIEYLIKTYPQFFIDEAFKQKDTILNLHKDEIERLKQIVFKLKQDRDFSEISDSAAKAKLACAENELHALREELRQANSDLIIADAASSRKD